MQVWVLVRMTIIDTTQFTDSIVAGMNNPECSFWVGASLGNWLSFRYLIAILLFFIIWKALDKLCLEPGINWIKNKMVKK